MPGRRSTQAGTVVAFMVGQSSSPLSPAGASAIKSIKSAPPYSGQLPQVRLLRERTTVLHGRAVTIRTKVILPEHYVIEVTTRVPNIFSPHVLVTKDQLLVMAKRALAKLPVVAGLSEEYTLYCVKSYGGNPRKFFRYRKRMVSMMKSESLPLSDDEISSTLEHSSLQYAKDDLTIVDWDGAFIFERRGDWTDAVNLLQVANTHLLRLRVLDAQLDQHLTTMLDQIERLPSIRSGQVRRTMSNLMHLRTTAIKDFEHTERDIQLIGDWYAAKLYAMATRKFSLERWRAAIREELNTLQEMSTMAADYFSVTAERRAEQVQQVLWYVQLVGWFVLLFLEWRVLRP